MWESVIKLLVKRSDCTVYFLDRGNAPIIDKVQYVPFPTFWAKDGPADSFLIQNVCDELDIDVFTSSYYTTPINTPMVLMVYDMIPELFNFDMSPRIWMEKGTAIHYAQQYLCISENTRKDLLSLYPEIPPSCVKMAYCGVDRAVFRPLSQQAIDAFRREHGLHRPYFLFVGSRVQHNGYKNSELFFNALSRVDQAKFDIFCVGGEKEIEASVRERLPSGVQCKRVELSDDELALAYGGALALVYPSLYEGFGMPVIEAMASGCPVITTNRGSLAEAAGEAAYLVEGTSVDEMHAALLRIQDNGLRNELIRKGLQHSQIFTWLKMADTLYACLAATIQEAETGKFDAFFDTWKSLRQRQANVDYLR